MVYCNTFKEEIFWMKFFIFTYKCVNKYNFNSLIRILLETIVAGDVSTNERA